MFYLFFSHFSDLFWSNFEVVFAPRRRSFVTGQSRRSFLGSFCCQGPRHGSSWVHFGPSWAHLGPSWVIFGPKTPFLLIIGSILGSKSCQNVPRCPPKAVQENLDSEYLRFKKCVKTAVELCQDSIPGVPTESQRQPRSLPTWLQTGSKSLSKTKIFCGFARSG